MAAPLDGKDLEEACDPGALADRELEGWEKYWLKEGAGTMLSEGGPGVIGSAFKERFKNEIERLDPLRRPGVDEVRS